MWLSQAQQFKAVLKVCIDEPAFELSTAAITESDPVLWWRFQFVSHDFKKSFLEALNLLVVVLEILRNEYYRRFCQIFVLEVLNCNGVDGK